jgi:hypothetical protein
MFAGVINTRSSNKHTLSASSVCAVDDSPRLYLTELVCARRSSPDHTAAYTAPCRHAGNAASQQVINL